MAVKSEAGYHECRNQKPAQHLSPTFGSTRGKTSLHSPQLLLLGLLSWFSDQQRPQVFVFCCAQELLSSPCNPSRYALLVVPSNFVPRLLLRHVWVPLSATIGLIKLKILSLQTVLGDCLLLGNCPALQTVFQGTPR